MAIDGWHILIGAAVCLTGALIFLRIVADGLARTEQQLALRARRAREEELRRETSGRKPADRTLNAA